MSCGKDVTLIIGVSPAKDSLVGQRRRELVVSACGDENTFTDEGLKIQPIFPRPML